MMTSDERLLSFLFAPDKETYLHVTSRERAKRILEQGLVIEDVSLETIRQGPAALSRLEWQLHPLCAYGDSVVTIQLPRPPVEEFLERLTLWKARALAGHDGFDPRREQYLLPRKYIKGYFGFKTTLIVENEYFA